MRGVHPTRRQDRQRRGRTARRSGPPTASDGRGGTTMSTATIGRGDEEIQRDVLDELDFEPRVQPHEIGVAVAEGVVTLTGWVENYAKKWAAERAAHRVNRVRAVANDIEVRLARAAQRTRGRPAGPAGA